MYTVFTPEQLFTWAGQATSYGWLILIFLPRFKALFVIPQYIIPIAIGLIYAGLMLTHYSSSDGGFGSIAAVRSLFDNDYVLLAGWIHYLAFDLFVGAWIAGKSDTIGLSRLIQAPILMATYIFGPIGLIIFLSIRTMFTQTAITHIKEQTYVS
jgi:hypothetical protein